MTEESPQHEMTSGVLEQVSKEGGELFKLFLSPVAKESGELLGDFVHYFRVATALGVLKVLKRAKQILVDHGIEPKGLNLKILIPILQGASLEDNPELAEKWAGLLASAATGESIHLSYTRILSELSPNDAQILQLMYEWFLSNDPDLTLNFRNKFSERGLRENIRISEYDFRKSINTLVGYALCHLEEVGSDMYLWEGEMQNIYLTYKGFDFVRICQGPQKGLV